MITFNSSAAVSGLKYMGSAIKKQFIKVTSILVHLGSVTAEGVGLKRKQSSSCQTEKPLLSFMSMLSRNKSQNQTEKYQTPSSPINFEPVLKELQRRQKKPDVIAESMTQDTKIAHHPQEKSKQPAWIKELNNNQTFKFMSNKNTDTENLLKPTRVAPAIPPIQRIDDLVTTISMIEKSKQETLASAKPCAA